MIIQLNDIYQLLEKICTELHVCASVWGSLQRNELTPLSDIDIICYSNSITDSIAMQSSIKRELSYYFHNFHRWDIALIEGNPYDYALMNGTNYHSVYFSDLVVGDKEQSKFFLTEREKLRNNLQLSYREFFNLFTSYYGLAKVLNTKDARFAKFSINGTNKWVRLAQAAQLRWNYLIGRATKDIIVFLCQKYKLDTTRFIGAYESDFNYRIESELSKKIKVNTAHFSEWQLLFQVFLTDSIPWIQSDLGVSVSLLKEFIQSMNIKMAEIPAPKNINLLSESIINAFIEKNPQKLKSIYEDNKNDWWIMTNLCINEHVPSELLEQIVFPQYYVNPTLWKSVRLYVAKNRNTSEKTLSQILNTKGLREQDYLAAQNNLDSRK